MFKSVAANTATAAAATAAAAAAVAAAVFPAGERHAPQVPDNGSHRWHHERQHRGWWCGEQPAGQHRISTSDCDLPTVEPDCSHDRGPDANHQPRVRGAAFRSAAPRPGVGNSRRPSPADPESNLHSGTSTRRNDLSGLRSADQSYSNRYSLYL